MLVDKELQSETDYFCFAHLPKSGLDRGPARLISKSGGGKILVAAGPVWIARFLSSFFYVARLLFCKKSTNKKQTNFSGLSGLPDSYLLQSTLYVALFCLENKTKKQKKHRYFGASLSGLSKSYLLQPTIPFMLLFLICNKQTNISAWPVWNVSVLHQDEGGIGKSIPDA